jgi:hypothetical protein
MFPVKDRSHEYVRGVEVQLHVLSSELDGD